MKLDWVQYLDHIRSDGDQLAEAATGHLDDPIPWCPDWVGRDVVAHTGVVHRHKLAIVAGSLQENIEPEPAPTGDDALLPWFREGLNDLLSVLATADPATPVHTWHPPDQSVGFWIRRMAHETAIHRGDAESASGPITPLDARLAADGVDEVLGPIMCAYTDAPRYEFEADGRTATIRMTDTGHAAHLAFGSGRHGPGWTHHAGEARAPDTVISATSSNLDLWAWGRAEPSVLLVEGDATLAALIRTVAAEATG